MVHTLEEAEVFAKKNVFDVFPKYNLILAGGAIRDYMTIGTVTNDLDIYFYCQTQIDKFTKEFKYLADSTSKYGFVFEYIGNKYHAITYKTTESPDELIQDFDFPVNAVAISLTKTSCHKHSISDMVNMIIGDIISPRRNTAIYRMVHLMRKGFFPTSEVVYTIKQITANNVISRDPNGDLHIPFNEDVSYGF